MVDDARQEGQVQIKRRDGQMFVIKPVEEKKISAGCSRSFDGYGYKFR